MYTKFYPNYNFLEVCLILFDRCNLGCSFCFQDHSHLKSPSEIESLFKNLIPQLEQSLRSRPHINHLIFRIWGGEVFMDMLDDSYLIAYKNLQEKISKWLNEHNYTYEFCYSSNLIFNKIDRIKKFLEDTKSTIATSYDPVERFHTQEQEDLWWTNIKEFHPEVISITLTKLNIEKYINSNILFKLKDYIIYPEYYIHNRNWQKYAPTSEDILNFYKYYYNSGLTNIPELNLLIESYNNPNGRYCVCSNSCSFINDKLTFSCLLRSGTVDMLNEYGMTLEQCMSDKCTSIQYNLTTSKLKCFSCEHYNYCRLPCMASQLHKSKDSSCAIDQFYKWLGNN